MGAVPKCLLPFSPRAPRTGGGVSDTEGALAASAWPPGLDTVRARGKAGDNWNAAYEPCILEDSRRNTPNPPLIVEASLAKSGAESAQAFSTHGKDVLFLY